MRRLSRVFRLLIMAVLLLEAVYLVGANVGLLILPGLMNQAPERMLVHFQAFSPFPGLVLVRDFSLRSQDPYVQWQLEVGRARAWVDLRSVREQTFHVRDVNASGVSFRLRRKLRADEVTPELTLAQPPIEGYGPVALRQEGAFEMLPMQPTSWTIRMDRVNANAHELWIDALKYAGPMHASGAWSLHLDREAWVGPAKLELLGGTVTHGSCAVSTNVRGQADVSLDPFQTREVPGAKILDFLDAKLSLFGGLPDVAGTARALGASPQLAIDGSPGQVALNARVRGGLLEPGSKVSAEIPSATMKLGALSAAGGAVTSAEVTPKGRIDINVRGERMSLRDPRSGLQYIQGAAVHLKTQVPGNDVRAFKAPKTAQLELIRSAIPNLTAFNQLIPEPLGFAVNGGRGTVDGKLNVNLKKGVGSGQVNVRMRGVALRQQHDAVKGDLDLRLRVQGVRPDFRRVTLSGSRVSLRGMKVTSEKGQKPWNGQVKLPTASLNLDRREVFRGSLDVRLEDARPFFRAMLDRTDAPGLAKKLFAPNDVHGLADVGFGPGWVRVDGLIASVGRTQVSGIARLTRNSQQGAVRISAGPLSAGLELRDGMRSLKLLASRDWFVRQQLRVLGKTG